jgi:putative protease
MKMRMAFSAGGAAGAVSAGSNAEFLISGAAKKGIGDILDGVLVSNPGHISHVRTFFGDVDIICDYTFNIFNSNSAQYLFDQGINNITFSPELTLGHLSNMKKVTDISAEIIAYGRIPVMNTKYCAIGSITGGLTRAKKCSSACINGSYALKDRMGAEFPVISDRAGCSSIVLNSKVLYIPGELRELRDAGISTFRINVYDETPDEVSEIIKVYRSSLAFNKGSSYSEDGHYSDSRYYLEGGSGYSKILNKLMDKGITKGHLFRGV